MKKVVSAVLAAAIMLSLGLRAGAANITHGTSGQTVTEDMVNNTPPADYVIDQSIQAAAREGKYNAWFPDTQLQEVHIEIEENNLNYLLQNAVDEPYVMTTSVTIGNTTLGYCGLKTKGNYTLYHSYHDNPNSDRFSFTVNFGKYITKEAYGEKQNFYGCEKISFNNFFFDKSMMKEFFALKLMEEMGLPTPQYALAKLYINGEYYGVYFMVEAMDETVLEQYWNVKGSELSDYLLKPTGTRLLYDELKADWRPLFQSDEQTYNEVRDVFPTVVEWVRRLNLLSEKKDFDGNAIDVQSDEYIALLETVLDLEEVIKYFAVSSWLCQMDNMFMNLQNYGLYVSEQGVATLIPWDYDLAFGCYYPSTAQNTANYPLDVMYSLDLNQVWNESYISAMTYKNFPLFNVIYQNKALMEKYHSYMAECSQIAALGGTVESTGKSYAPAYFDSYIEAMRNELIAAASEKLADHVYYMNNITQPNGVEEALPNLSAIIAQRSVGVWVQAKGLDTTVCGSGCDLETLGNALTGEYANSGNLTTVDPATGIFVSAEYSGGRRTFSPVLKVEQPAQGDETFLAIKKALDWSAPDTALVYSVSSSVRASSAYTLTIPVTPEYVNDATALSFYLWEDGQLTPLEVTREEHLFTATVSTLGTVVIHVQPPLVGSDGMILLMVGGVLAAAAVAAAAVMVVKKKSCASTVPDAGA